MWKEDLNQKKTWFTNYTEVINQKLDEFYSTVPDSGLSEREQYLYDTAQNQFKMLYEVVDRSKDLIDTELMMIGDAIKTKKSVPTHL